MSHIGNRIAERRKDLGLTQQDLADKLGYKSKTTINKIELGINDLRQRKIVEFAKALQCSPPYLMGWTDDPNPHPNAEQKSTEDDAPSDLIIYKGKKIDISKLTEEQKDDVVKYIEFIISKNADK